MSSATGITLVVHGEREGVSDDGDLIAVWTEFSSVNEENAHYRRYAVTARVFVAWDRQVGPDEDDPLDRLEQLENQVIAATTPIVGGAVVVNVASEFHPSAPAVDVTFVGEVRNADSEV